MPNEPITTHDIGPRHDLREVYQERVKGTVDLDSNGEATFIVWLSGDMEAIGRGPFGTVAAGNGDAELTAVSTDEAIVAITNGTAGQLDVEFELVVAEDGFYHDSGDPPDGGSAP